MSPPGSPAASQPVRRVPSATHQRRARRQRVRRKARGEFCNRAIAVPCESVPCATIAGSVRTLLVGGERLEVLRRQVGAPTVVVCPPVGSRSVGRVGVIRTRPSASRRTPAACWSSARRSSVSGAPSAGSAWKASVGRSAVRRSPTARGSAPAASAACSSTPGSSTPPRHVGCPAVLRVSCVVAVARCVNGPAVFALGVAGRTPSRQRPPAVSGFGFIGGTLYAGSPGPRRGFIGGAVARQRPRRLRLRLHRPRRCTSAAQRSAPWASSAGCRRVRRPRCLRPGLRSVGTQYVGLLEVFCVLSGSSSAGRPRWTPWGGRRCLGDRRPRGRRRGVGRGELLSRSASVGHRRERRRAASARRASAALASSARASAA